MILPTQPATSNRRRFRVDGAPALSTALDALINIVTTASVTS